MLVIARITILIYYQIIMGLIRFVCPGPILCLSRCHIIDRPHSKNRPRLSRDYKIDDISLNTHTNRFKCKPHITNMYIHTFGINQLLIMY